MFTNGQRFKRAIYGFYFINFKAYNKCLKKIDNLIDMRASGEITEQQFKDKKTKLIQKKIKLQK